MTPRTPTTLRRWSSNGATIKRRAGEREELVLGADEDVHALAALGEAEQLDQVTLGFEVREQLADALEVFEAADVLQQIGLAAHDQALVVAELARPGGKPRLDHLLGELVELGLGRGQLPFDRGPGLGQGQAANVGVEIVGGLDEARRRQTGGQVDHAVLDALVVADQHHQRLAGLQRHELDVLEPAHLLVGKDHAGAGRQAGDHLAGVGEHLLDRLLAPDPELGLDLAALVVGEVADLEQPVDEQPEAHLGRQPARRGVRGVDQPQMLQIRHDVADRGRRQGHRQMPRQIARAHGIAGRQIALDDLPEDGARALVELLQLGEAAGGGRGTERLVGGHLREMWLLGVPSLRFAPRAKHPRRPRPKRVARRAGVLPAAIERTTDTARSRIASANASASGNATC